MAVFSPALVASRDHCLLATFREDVPAQPVDATPSGINLFSKGGVYEI
jgi:hypothetical protein